MNIIGQVVEHKSLGEGIICNHKIKGEVSYIIVDFSGDHKEFQFPDIFKNIIKAKEENFKQHMAQLVEEKKDKDKMDELNRTLQRQKEEKHFVKDEPIVRKAKLANKKNKKSTTKSTSTRVRKKNDKTEKDHNIAFKCNFCDGGKSQEQVGYNGLCSVKTIKANIESGRGEWCKFSESPCRQYYDGDINRKELEEYCKAGRVCYESKLLKNWVAYAGYSYDKEGIGTPRRIVRAKVNQLCILTTRNPDMEESQRYIFAVFLIDDAFQGEPKDDQEGCVESRSKYRIKLSPKQAKQMLFWNYYHDKEGTEGTRWYTGLFRYMNDEMAAQILRDIAKIKKGTHDEKLADDFFKYFCNVNDIDIDSIGENNGALKR
ncbi:hypothetical protein [Intestinibacter sp.]